MPVGEARVGDRVRFTWAGRVCDAAVVEDRGPIGVGGRRLLRVEVLEAEAGQDAARFEVPAERVELVVAGPAPARDGGRTPRLARVAERGSDG